MNARLAAVTRQASYAQIDKSRHDAAPEAARPPFELLHRSDFDALPAIAWRIHSVLPATGVAGVFGPSGSGKSFLTLDMGAAIARSDRWFDYRVKNCTLLYVVLEGEAGFRRRVEAWEIANGQPFPNNALFLFAPFRLTDPVDLVNLGDAIAAAGGADVVVIDTLNRAAPESDENSSQDMGRILQGTKELQAMTGGLIVLVHHTGKDAAKGMRGHSSLFAALDAAIEVSRTDDRREWKVAKSKDGVDGEIHPFRLDVVDLGEDEDGEPITSCVLRAVDADADEQAHRPKLPKTGNQRIVYDALQPLLRASRDFSKAGAPINRPCLDLDAAIDQVRSHLVVEPKRRTERARLALNGLVASGIVGCNQGWIWLK